MNLRILSINNQEYTNFVKLHGSVFNTKQWLSLFGGDLVNYGIYNGNEIIAVFFILKIKLRGFIDVYGTPFFTPDNGLIINNEYTTLFKRNSTNKKILTVLADFINHQKLHYLQFKLPDTILDMQPFIWLNLNVRVVYSYLLDLSLTEQEIYHNMDTTRRHDMTKAIRENIDARLITDYNIIRELIIKTFNRQNAKIRLDYVDKILLNFANNVNSYSYVSYFNGKPAAGVFIVYDKQRAYCLLSGYDDKNEHRGAGVLAHYNAIKHAKELGVQIFDFEGSMLRPVENFYRGFGGKLVPKFVISKQSRLFSLLSMFRR